MKHEAQSKSFGQWGTKTQVSITGTKVFQIVIDLEEDCSNYCSNFRITFVELHYDILYSSRSIYIKVVQCYK